MCNKALDNYPHTLGFVPECYKTQNMCDKAVDAYLSTIKFIPECHKAQEICNKAVNWCFFVLDSIPDRYKIQQMCDRVVSEDPFLIVYYPDKYITQKCVMKLLVILLQHWNLFSTGLLQVKRWKKTWKYKNILYLNEGSGSVIFNCNEMGILNIDFNNI